MKTTGARLLYICIVFLCCLIPQLSLADTVDVYGLSLEVDKLKTVRGKKGVFEIAIGEDVALVPEKQLKAHVAKRVLGKRALEFKAEQLQRLYRGAMQAGDKVVAEEALHALFLHQEIGDKKGSELVRTFCGLSEQLALCSTLLDRKDLKRYNRGMLASLVIEAAARREERVTSNISKLSFLFDSSFKQQLQRAFDHDIKSGSGDSVIAACIVIFGDADKSCQKLKQKESGISHVLEDMKKGSFASLDKLTRQAARNPELGYRVAPLVQKEIHRLTRVELARKDYAKALNVIAYLPANWCTSETQQLAITILNNVTTQHIANASLRTKNFIEGIREQNVDIGTIYESKLEESLYEYVRNGNLAEADEALLRMLLLRSDPDVDNDDLRFYLAMAHARAGNSQRARELVADVGTSLSVTQRLTLMTSGLYINRALLFFLILSPFVGVLVWYGLRRARYGNKEMRKPVIREIDEYEEEEELPLFSSRTMNRLDPRAAEYNRNLVILGLEPGCDLRSIKSAYRALMKELHPDRRKAMDDETNRKFHELQKAYERVLQLRSEMGI